MSVINIWLFVTNLVEKKECQSDITKKCAKVISENIDILYTADVITAFVYRFHLNQSNDFNERE